MNSLDFILNFEHVLPILIQEYGLWIYVILFLIIFSETAFSSCSFYQDSLLLTVGASMFCNRDYASRLYHQLTFMAAALGLYGELSYRSSFW